jgi:plasmid stabilization system protein ParE
LACLIYSVRALADLERLTDFLIESDPHAALKTVGLIEEVIELLERHPMIGRPVEPPLRELVISRGKSGYLALYSFESVEDAVLILAIRHQRELGYGEDPMA